MPMTELLDLWPYIIGAIAVGIVLWIGFCAWNALR
jgi:hypothetical protein